MSVCERLYEVQLHFKKRKSDHCQKIDEAQKMRTEYIEQAKDLMVGLYASSLSIWTVINAKPDISLHDALKRQYKAIVPNSKAKIARFLRDLRANPAALLAKLQKEPESPHAFMCLVCLFNFCWSEESMSTFLDFVQQADPKMQPLLSQCLLVNPLTHVYFRAAVSRAFDLVSVKTDDEMSDMILCGLKEHASMLPLFIRRSVEQAKDGTGLFWNTFLKTVLVHFYLFGVAPIEYTVFVGDKINSVIAKLEKFFAGKEGRAFVKELLDVQKNPVICKEPSEKLLLSVAPEFRSISCLDAKDLKAFMESDTKIESGLLFVQMASTERSKGERDTFYDVSDNVLSMVRRFLMDADLLKLPEEREETIDYFEQLASLSSVFGDSELEFQLDRLAEKLSDTPMSIEDICTKLEESIKNKKEDAGTDPLEDVIPYNNQYAYVKRLKEMNDEVQKRAAAWLEFQCVLKAFNEAIAQPGNELPADVKQLPKYVSRVGPVVLKSAGLEDDIPIMRAFCSMILARTDIVKSIQQRSDVKKMDEEIHSFITKNKDTILEENLNMDFLEPYKKNPKKFVKFNEEFELACQSQLPFSCLDHIHRAYNMLATLLQMSDIGEIGADQLVPFALTATVLANTPGIWKTQALMSDLMTQLTGTLTPIEHAAEYSLIQFTSTCQYLQRIMTGQE